MDEQIPPVTPASVETPQPTHLAKKIIVTTAIIAGLIFAFAVWWMFSGNGKSLAVDILVPEKLQTGIPVEFAVTMNNDSGSDLADAQVNLTLPEGIIFVGVPGEHSVENRRIGNLDAKKLTKEVFNVMAVGAENTVMKVQASVSYIPGALRSRFEKQISKDVVIGEPGITLSIAPPAKVFGGESFDTEVTYKNNSQTNFDNVAIKLAYPSGFSFTSATAAASDSANTTWQLGALPAGSEGKFSVKGFLVGQDNANFEIRATLSSQIGDASYDIASQTASLSIAPSPLSIRINVGDDDNSIFSPGSGLTYRLSYANNTTVGLRDVIVTAKLVGEMFDLRTLKTSGVLRASDNTIVWNAARVPEFANLPPNASGFLEFGITTKSAYPITRLSSKNYTLAVQAAIESPTVPRNVAANRTLGQTSISNKMRGALNIATLGYYRDAIAGIINKGPMPPKVGVATQTTIHWVLRNTSTDVSDIHVRAFLGPNVRYTGISKTNAASTTLEYNERTQELGWSVPRIPATRGILSEPVTMIFQIELTPAIDQLHTSPKLILDTGMSYTDTFTSEPLSGGAASLTTSLPDDATIVNIAKGVQE